MSKERRLSFISIAIGVGYGLFLRGIPFAHPTAEWIFPVYLVMSVAFVIILPFSMGYLAVATKGSKIPVRILESILLPWAVVILSLLACALANWEGLICICMMAPIALVCGSLGGFAAGVITRRAKGSITAVSMLVVAMLPFLVGATEHRVQSSPEIRSIESSTEIHASAGTIWENIERVRQIDESELPVSWNRKIGFPRPIEATLSHEGIGGVRNATFAGNVLFVETIDKWEPERRLGFSIHADSSSIPPTTLDEHVTVGGEYFEVLHGEYSLEPVGDGRILLRLVSRHRVSTDFNWYAHLWTDAVMQDVQRSILYVIKNRCEKATGG